MFSKDISDGFLTIDLQTFINRRKHLKKDDSPLLAGLQIFHNYIRPHMGLNGQTPAQACGIDIQGDNKWITLIQNASRREA